MPSFLLPFQNYQSHFSLTNFSTRPTSIPNNPSLRLPLRYPLSLLLSASHPPRPTPFQTITTLPPHIPPLSFIYRTSFGSCLDNCQTLIASCRPPFFGQRELEHKLIDMVTLASKPVKAFNQSIDVTLGLVEHINGKQWLGLSACTVKGSPQIWKPCLPKLVPKS